MSLGGEQHNRDIHALLSFFKGKNLMIHLSQEFAEGIADLKKNKTKHYLSPCCINIIFLGGEEVG